MARAAIAVAVAVLIGVALLPVRSYLTEPREVIASTPSAYTGVDVPVSVPASKEACADEILFSRDAEFARFSATAPAGKPAPLLDVVASGYTSGPYANGYRSQVDVPGGWRGTRVLDVPIKPPRRDVFGTFCIRNTGREAIALVGNENGRAFSRPTLRVDGKASPTDLPLRFLEAERRSYLSRAGQVMERAAALLPFGAWWWWLLAVGVVVLAPACLLLAMRSALAADAPLMAREPARRAAWPSERTRRRVQRIPGWVLVAALGLLAVLWFLYWGINTHVFQSDEDQYVYLSRWLQTDFPATLWNFDVYGRGLQRLEVWLLAVPAALFDAPASLIAGRLLNAVAFVSTAVPIFLLGRGMGLRPQWAAVPAVVSVVVPWAVVTTAFLTENVAYPTCLWAIWAIWRAAAEPSARRDLLALVLLVVAGAARSGLLLLAPVLPAVVLLTGLRCGDGGIAARLRRTLREHVVLWVGVAIAAMPLLLAPLGVDAADSIRSRLAGGYPTTIHVDVWPLLEKMGSYFSRTVIGTGFFAAAVALPWLVVQLARARDRTRFAFAAVVVLAAAALLWSLIPAGPDERYILYLAPLVLLPATVAVARGEIPPVGLAITSVLLAALLVRVSWNPDQGPFAFFVAPAEMFYSRAVGLRLATYLPGTGADMLTLVPIALGLAGVALAAALRWRPGALAGGPAVLIVAAAIAIVPMQAQYAFSKYVNGAGSRSAADLGERAFADRAVPEGARVAEFAEGAGLQPEYFPLWQEVQFYNQRIDTVYTLGSTPIPVPPGDALIPGVGYDERTGRIESPVPLPEYVVVATRFGDVNLRGEVIRAPAYVAVALLRLAQPATLDSRATGFGPGGTIPAGGEGLIRFYGTGLPPGPHCATLTLTAPVESGARWRVAAGRRTVRAGSLDAGERREVMLPLPRLVRRGFVDVRVAGQQAQVLTAGVGGEC